MKPEQPEACGAFHCPYQLRDGYHRPDNFQKTLEELGGDIGNYIPMIPVEIPVEKANQIIRDTRTVLACVLNGGEWVDVVMPLDRYPSGGWLSRDPGIWKI